MARIRDLGINALPMTIRPLEIGPGAVVGGPVAQATPYLACGPSNCAQCPCDNSNFNDTSLACAPPTQCIAPTQGAPRDGYHASGFTLQSVAELRQQLQAKRKELDH
jgi:hypothetical protein